MNQADTVTISLATLSDAASIAELSRDSIEYGLQWSWTPARVGRCIVAPDINVIAARQGDKMIGFGIMFYGNSSAHLNLLAVEPAWRGKGIGHRLMSWLEKCAITAGLEHCRLEVREANNAAKQFYRAHGYSEIERLNGYYQRRESAIRMGRYLRQDISEPE